jgi:phage gp36-like protein
MSYATIDNVINRYKPIQTMIGVGSYQVTSAEVASSFIADAESFIDAYLAARYVVPVPATPLVTQLASDLAVFNMAVEKLPEVPDFMQARYDRCLKTLEMLRDGKMFLSSATVTTSGDQEAWSTTQDYHPVFSPVLDPIDQAADIDRVEADQDARSDDGIPELT